MRYGICWPDKEISFSFFPRESGQESCHHLLPQRFVLEKKKKRELWRYLHNRYHVSLSLGVTIQKKKNVTKEHVCHPRPAMTLMHVDIAISVLIFNAPSPLSFFFPLLMQLVSDKRRRRCPMPFLAEWKKGTLKQPSATEEAFSLFFRPDFCSG